MNNIRHLRAGPPAAPDLRGKYADSDSAPLEPRDFRVSDYEALEDQALPLRPHVGRVLAGFASLILAVAFVVLAVRCSLAS